jgi:hypothetical protein
VRRGRLRWIALAACLVAEAAPAQERPKRTFGRDLDWMADDIVFVWTAPFHLRARDLEGIAVVTGATAGAMAVDQRVTDWVRDNPRSLPVRVLGPFREHSPLNLYGRTPLLVPVSVALYAAGVALDDDDLRDAGVGCATSNAATTLSRYVLTNLIGRARPQENRGAFAFEPLAFGDWGMRSFFGGHAANAVTCSAFWSERFELGVAEPLLYGFAGAVSFARVADDAHWLSDTVLGIAWGYAIGKAVAARFGRRAGARAAQTYAPARVYVGWSVTF